jgi:Ser/Thr protein kinase RdoA (MazF antagonist)
MREALAAWGEPTVIGMLGGGNRNEVVEVRLGGRRLVARRSRREPASLDWEIALLDHLAASGVRVPLIIPALDGQRHVDGVVVTTWLDGAPPTESDWPAVTDALHRIHALTAGWPQRPGHASTAELLTAERGGDVDLSAMASTDVAACRAAWSRLARRPQAVVHGDPGPSNIRIHATGVGLLDWDEARVDYTDLDLAELPTPVLTGDRLADARAAATAWEAANGWLVEPSYAKRQLALLRAGRDPFSDDR